MIYFLVGTIVLSPVIWLTLLSATAKQPTNLGVVDGRLAPCPNTPNCVSTQASDDQHQIEPIAFDGDGDGALKRLKAAIRTIPRMQIVTETDNYLHAEATSLLFRFVDDVEFFVDRNAKVIHFRSASRVGRSDMGVNRRRMEQIRAAFQRRDADLKH
jgi:uncharacterized protein (DUF1499 family)